MVDIKGYFTDDENILLLNSLYIPPKKISDGVGFRPPVYDSPVLYLVYRDLDTGKKKLKIIEDPEVTYFITKKEHRLEFKTQRRYMYKNDVDEYTVPYSKIAKSIIKAIRSDNTDADLLPICKNEPKEAFKWRHAYFSDYNIRDYAIISYILQQKRLKREINTNISAAFLDIESDIYGLTTTEIDNGCPPINAVSVVVANDINGERLKHPIVFTYLLRNYERYKDQEYFENHLKTFVNECHNEFDEKYHTPEFKITLYDDEIKMLKSLFKMLHTAKPDFILIWNMQYDIPAIIKRLMTLGEDPTDYFCHPDFEKRYYRYNYDKVFINDIKNSSDSFDCTSYSMWVDQMRNYAGIRKSSSDYGGNNLDNIANIELKSEKRRYNSKTVNVLNGAIEEYWNFVKYSINDVLLQYGIDEKTDDLTVLFEQSLYGGTRFSKTLKQTVYLKNYFAIGYLERDIVPGNNTNVNYLQNTNQDTANDADEINLDDIMLRGALVADPMLNDNTGIKILGEPSFTFFKLAADMDYSSMYPNAKITANMAGHTQYFRIIIDDQIIPDENPDNDPKFMRGGKFIEDFTTDDGCNTGRWLGLNSTYDYIKEFGEQISNIDALEEDLIE